MPMREVLSGSILILYMLSKPPAKRKLVPQLNFFLNKRRGDARELFSCFARLPEMTGYRMSLIMIRKTLKLLDQNRENFKVDSFI